jgi:predicted anti-sigma-YlaC factor YlaD
MSDHIQTWLQAYHDGELRGAHRRRVEAHLESCSECQEILGRIQSLSALLQGSPIPVFTPSDRFAAQVALRLPRQPTETGWQRTARLGWQMAPFGLIGVWAFTQAAFFTVTILALVERSCTVCRDYLAWLSLGNGTIYWAFGLNVLVSVLLGLLYSSWLAGWWVSHQRGRAAPQNGLTH